MKITFLGTSHGAPELGRYCTSLFIEHNGYGFILDLGAPTEYLLKQKGFEMDKVKGIFITHMHADHVEALTSVTKYFSVYNTDAEADLFLPESEAVQPYKAWISCMHINVPDRLRVNVVKEGVIYDKYGLRVTAIRTEHFSNEIPSYAYFFEADGKRVLFTGDLAYDYHDYPKILYTENFDLVVAELTHLSADKLWNIFDGTKTKMMIFSHIWPENAEYLGKNAVEFDFPYFVANDGFEYYVV